MRLTETKFDKVRSLRHSAECDPNSDIFSLLNKCKRLGRVYKAQHSINLSIPPDFRCYVPQRKTSDQLVQAYLRTFESVYRILHVPSFQQEYDSYWISPQSASTAFVVKLLLVMAIGTCFYQDPAESTSLRSSSVQWIYTAQFWLSSPLEKSRINLTGVQIHCLLLLARQTSASDGDLIWVSAGSLLRTAMHSGLHRDPRHLPKISAFQSESRRRLWATVMEIMVQSSMDSGGPPLISCQDFDCEPPSNVDDWQIDENVKTPLVSRSMDTFTQTSLQVLLSRSLPLRLEIAKLINDFRSDASYDETIRLGTELTALIRSNSLLVNAFSKDQAKPTAFQTKLLDLLTQRFLLALHFPFAIKAKTNLNYYFSRKICLDSSLSLLSYSPSPAILSSQTQGDDYTQAIVLGGGLFRNILPHAAINVCLELITQLQEDPPPFTSSSRSLSRKELHKAIEDYVDLSARRIQAGETNVKGHLMASCILAQIDAMEAGTSVEQGMVNAVKKSLEFCYQLLKAKTEESEAQHLDVNSDGRQGIGVEFEDNGLGWNDVVSLGQLAAVR